eukprot:jgi/Ulvmu1/9452/UM052_0017.1
MHTWRHRSSDLAASSGFQREDRWTVPHPPGSRQSSHHHIRHQPVHHNCQPRVRSRGESRGPVRHLQPSGIERAHKSGAWVGKPASQLTPWQRIEKGGVLKRCAVQAETAPQWMIVGLQVLPCSIKRTQGEPLEQILCRPWGSKENPEPQVVAEGEDIVYTYDVYWQETDIEWVNRWNAYMRPPPSIVFHVGLYAAVPLLVMLSMLWQVIRRTTAVDPLVDARVPREQKVVAQQQWKRLAGDVLRAPPDAGTLAYRTATGAQLLCAAAAALALTAAGALAPARRGAFLTAAPALYCGLSAVGGFVAVALLRSMQHSTQHGPAHWTTVCLKTATFFPGVAFILYATVATAATAAGSTLAATPAVYAYLAALWLTLGVPLTFLGGALALRAPPPTWPAATHKAPPSEAPAPTPLAMWSTRCQLYLGAVLFPAWAFFFALNPLMQSVWNGYFFGAPIALLAVSAVTVTCCAASSVLCTYKQLCAGDSDWWWPAFRRGGAVTVPLLMHAVIFRAVDLPALHGAGLLLYGCYMATVALAVYLCLGAVGFVASLLFVYCAYTRLADAEVAATATATDGDADGDTAAALREKLLKWEPDAEQV